VNAGLDALVAAGIDNIDIGCMQVNWHWHRAAFASPAAALNAGYTLTIRRLTPSGRHQLLRIAPDSGIRPSIGTENPIPEEIDHREIAVRMAVMSEVKFLHPSEPCKPPKPRSLDVVFLVEKDMRVVGRRTGDDLNHEEINRQDEIGTRSYQTHGDEEEGRIVAFVAKVRR
jgi:hypothetical protein